MHSTYNMDYHKEVECLLEKCIQVNSFGLFYDGGFAAWHAIESGYIRDDVRFDDEEDLSHAVFLTSSKPDTVMLNIKCDDMEHAYRVLHSIFRIGGQYAERP